MEACNLSSVSIEALINQFFDRLVECIYQRRLELLNLARDMAGKVEARKRRQKQLSELKIQNDVHLRNNSLRELHERIQMEIDDGLVEEKAHDFETIVFRGDPKDLELHIGTVGEVVEEISVLLRYKEMRKKEIVVISRQDQRELSNPVCVTFDEINQKIYVAEGFPPRVSIFSKAGEFLNAFTPERMKYPYGIVCNRNNLYLTDIQLHGVFHYKIGYDLKFQNDLTGRGHCELKFNYPRQLSVSYYGDVFIADYNNHRIQKLDKSLNFQKSFHSLSMHRPRDVKVKDNEVNVLTCEDYPCVHAFTLNGDILRNVKFGQDLNIPLYSCFFCLDIEHNILLSDCKSKCVRLFSPEGKHILQIGEFQEGDFDSPLGIVLTNQMELIVITPYDDSQLQIFS